jgi:hypothetical protein
MKPSICEGTAIVGIVRHDMETTDEEHLFARQSSAVRFCADTPFGGGRPR